MNLIDLSIKQTYLNKQYNVKIHDRTSCFDPDNYPNKNHVIRIPEKKLSGSIRLDPNTDQSTTSKSKLESTMVLNSDSWAIILPANITKKTFYL